LPSLITTLLLEPAASTSCNSASRCTGRNTQKLVKEVRIHAEALLFAAEGA
jgi:hypothetical protein